jgi:hypothetical protein
LIACLRPDHGRTPFETAQAIGQKSRGDQSGTLYGKNPVPALDFLAT